MAIIFADMDILSIAICVYWWFHLVMLVQDFITSDKQQNNHNLTCIFIAIVSNIIPKFMNVWSRLH